MTTQHNILNDVLTALPEEDRNEFLADIGVVLYDNVMRRAYKSLTLTQQDAFVHLLEDSSNDPENEKKSQALSTFLQEQVPDLNTFVREEVEKLQAKQKQALEALE